MQRDNGIRVLDGGSGFIVIEHCPWCGKAFPVHSAMSGSERLNPEGSRLATKPFLQNYSPVHGGEHGLSNEAADKADIQGM